MDGTVWCMVVAISMVPHYFCRSQIFLTTSLIHTSPNDLYPEYFKNGCCISAICLLANPKQKISQLSMSWESIFSCIFHIRLWMEWIPPRFLKCCNLSDMTGDKPETDFCLIIHSFIPSKPGDHHNVAYWCGQWITCSIVSLYVRNLGNFELFFYSQRSSHLPTIYHML